MLAQLRNVSLSFPDKKVLENVSLTVYRGDRIALVGEHGVGKTSLFRMLTGRLTPDSGEISMVGGVRIGHLQWIAMILTYTKDVLMNACGAVPNKRSASLR